MGISTKSTDNLRNEIAGIGDWDVYFALRSASRKYVYYKPLCYQLFPETENSKNWGKGAVWLALLVPIVRYIILFLSLDKQAHPGYEILYFLAKTWYWVVGLLMVLILCCWRKKRGVSLR